MILRECPQVPWAEVAQAIVPMPPRCPQVLNAAELILDGQKPSLKHGSRQRNKPGGAVEEGRAAAAAAPMTTFRGGREAPNAPRSP